jgi:serine/threonine protein kinase
MENSIKQYEPLWGSWYIDSFIGEGSFGRVYKIRREDFGKVYYSAVKLITIPQSETDVRLLRREGLDNKTLRIYFHDQVTDIIQEIDLMSEFRGNSNIVSFEDHMVIEKPDEIGWDILIRMELLTNLPDYITQKPLETKEIVKLGIDICHALELCAIKNTIHRDIKPDNIFVSEFGDFKLGDFGIARRLENTTATLSKKGAPNYMAPEVYHGKKYGANVDLYSLGIVLYEYLNHGRMPFMPSFPATFTPSDRDEAHMLRLHGDVFPALVDVPPELNNVILKACAFDRNKRYQTASEMRLDLERIIEPVKSPIKQFPKRIHIISAAAVLVAAIGVTVLALPSQKNNNGDDNNDFIDAIAIESATFTPAEPIVTPVPTPESAPAPTEALTPVLQSTPASTPVQQQTPEASPIFVTIGEFEYDITETSIRIYGTGTIDNSDFSKLGQFTNLTILEWSFFDDRIPLLVDATKSLEKLTRLSLTTGAVKDISSLALLSKLTYLEISNNLEIINDYSPLKLLPNLVELNLNFAVIDDNGLTVLKSLVGLDRLDVSHSSLTIEQISELQSALGFDCSVIYDPNTIYN